MKLLNKFLSWLFAEDVDYNTQEIAFIIRLFIVGIAIYIITQLV